MSMDQSVFSSKVSGGQCLLPRKLQCSFALIVLGLHIGIANLTASFADDCSKTPALLLQLPGDSLTSSSSSISNTHNRYRHLKPVFFGTRITQESQMASSTVEEVPVSQMERRKKRKALDKEKHSTASDDKGKKPKVLNTQKETVTPMETSSAITLPEFHISVFKDLASADAAVREAAVESLVSELQEVQKAFDELEKKELVEGGLKLEAEKNDGLNNCAPSVRYAVRRLIRGVSSSRECARQGFALGLTVLVGRVPSIRVDALMKLVVDLLEVSSSMKGQEVKDCLLGRLFAYGAISRSERLIEECVSDKNTSSIEEYISCLISLASKKRYLQEPAVSIILDLVEKLPVEVLLNQVLGNPVLHEWFSGANEIGNPDALLLALKMRDKVTTAGEVFGKYLPYPYSASALLSVEHLSSLTNCFKESTFCQPRVHSLWPVLVNILLPDSIMQDLDSTSSSTPSKKHRKNRKSSSSEEETGKNLRCFCEVVIESCLLSSSHDRKHLAFDILLLILPRLLVSHVPIVLSYKLVQCLMDILSTKDSWLFKVAQHFLRELSEWVKNDDSRRVAVIVGLQKHSNGKFDCITRTKTVKDLMGEFKTESGCMIFIQDLADVFLDEGHASEEPSDQSQTTDDNSEIGSIEDKESVGTLGTSEFLKSWVIESLPNVLKHLQLEPDAKFRVQKEILKFLAVQGIFSSSLGSEVTSFELQEKFRWPKVASSSSLCRMCIEQIQLLLSNAQKGEGPHVAAIETNDLGSYFMRFLSTLCNIPSVSLFRVLSDEDEKAFKELQDMETMLSREERKSGLSTDAYKLHALRYLLIQMVLQVLLRPGEFTITAAELIMCCKKAFATPDLLDSSGEDEVDDENAPELMDVLVDTLLSLLPQSSTPVRSAIEQVFKYFCQAVTDDGLLRMLRVIKKDLKRARHQVEETDEDDDENEEDFLRIEEDEDDDVGETGETGESDELTDDSEAVSGLEATDKQPSDDSDESDGGMDDDAMFRMDTYLARIFKERKNQAGGGENAHSQLVLFKLRVLSLLEIYLHENPGKPQVLKVLTNLTQAFINPPTTEGSEQLGQRIWGILQKKIFKAKDYPREGLELSMLEPLLEKNLKLASKPHRKKKTLINSSKKKQSASLKQHQMVTSLARDSTFWILKIIDASKFPESELQKVYNIFKDALTAYFDRKNAQMKSNFLKEIFKRRPWIGHHLFDFLLEKSCGSKSDYRRVEALDLLIEILKSLVSSNTDSGKTLKSYLPKLCHLVKELVSNMPDKQSRRAEVRKFCGEIFQIITSHCSKSELRRVETLDLVIEIFKSLSSSYITLKRHLPKLSHLIKEFAADMPTKQSSRDEVCKLCGTVVEIISSHSPKSELKQMDLDLVLEILQSSVLSKEILKNQLPTLCVLVKDLVTPPSKKDEEQKARNEKKSKEQKSTPELVKDEKQKSKSKKQSEKDEEQKARVEKQWMKDKDMVRSFCSGMFQVIASHKLSKSFVKALEEADAHAVCESELGEVFRSLKSE